MALTAFAPKEAFSDPDALGTVFVHDDLEVNVREEIKKGKGFYTTDDEKVIERLDRYEPLKRVAVSEVEKARAPRQSSRATASTTDGDKS